MVDLNLLTPYRILMTSFVIFAWTRAFFRYRERVLSWKELLFWTVVWLTVLIAIFIPGKTDAIAKFLGVGRGTEAIFSIAIIALFYLQYRLYAKIDKLERDIIKLVQQLTLDQAKRRS